MRKPRNSEDTKERVLAAAQKMFAEHGFAGTSLTNISQACGISEGLILHHFQSKKNLYHQVLEKLANDYAQKLMQFRQFDPDPAGLFEQSLSMVFDYWKQDSNYERISLWAYLEGQHDFTQKQAALTAGLAQMVGQLQAAGKIDRQIHPAVFLTMIIGPIHYWLRYRDRFKDAMQLPESPDQLDQIFVDQWIALIKNIAISSPVKECKPNTKADSTSEPSAS